MKRVLLTLAVILLFAGSMAAKSKKQAVNPLGDGQSDRAYWTELAYTMAAPVLENMANGTLQQNMKLELSPTWDNRDKKVAYMECFGRLMAGIAPWLTLPDDDTPEGQKRRQLREWALKAYANAVDPESPDYLGWTSGGQTLVDAAYVVESLFRGYKALCGDGETPVGRPVDKVRRRAHVCAKVFGVRLLEHLKRVKTSLVAVLADKRVHSLVLAERMHPRRKDDQFAAVGHRHARAVNGLVAEPC